MGVQSSRSGNGGRYLPPSPMSAINALELIRSGILKRDALTAAQLLHLKTYRGAPYDHAPHAAPCPADLTYRGIPHHVDR
jgi:hypothetical protein